MKEDTSPEGDCKSLSKIFKELSKLEQDFRQQETVCKTKTEELERATSNNKLLQWHLDKAYAEIESLKKKYAELEVGWSNEKEFYEQVLQKHTEKMNGMTLEYKNGMEKQDLLWKRLKNDLEEEHNAFVTTLQVKQGEDLIRLEKEVQRAEQHAKQLQAHLDATAEDNLLLQDKIRKLHQEYLPMDAYKTQLRNISATNEKLRAQCAHLKNECQKLANENADLQKHNERLNQFVAKFNDKQHEWEVASEEHRTIMNMKQTELAEVTIQCEFLKDENARLMKELKNYKGEFCNMDIHRNISEQNQILQELVKEMRNERLKCTGDQLQINLDETEERIKRLEQLICELKKVLVDKFS